MGDHKYTLDEIDRMRDALTRKIGYPRSCSFDASGAITENSKRDFAECRRQVEDELRTCMMGGIRPDELEAKYPGSESSAPGQHTSG